MNNFALTIKRAVLAGLCFAPGLSFAFDSGSTGADGAFNPTVNTVLQLPESGVFNFTTVNIPSGVTVTFKKNTRNTPVIFLASGNVTIAGTLSVAGTKAPDVGAAGDGNLGDDGMPGIGGPGGYDGGRGGQTSSTKLGGGGLGPGGGGQGTPSSTNWSSTSYGLGGGGGGFSAAGLANQMWQNYGSSATTYGAINGAGASYGSNLLLPLIGGSGGGGGGAGPSFGGSGGGGGGGAILVASSGTVNVTGTITASGGNGGDANGVGSGGTGGGGSGGGIRIVATTIAGNGPIQATAGNAGFSSYYNPYSHGGKGADGRIRLEAESFTRTAATSPSYTTGAPGQLFVAGMPTLAISSVAGVAAPAVPTGNADINLPADTPNPVTIVLNTSGVPVGNTVKLTVTPAYGAPIVVTSPALTGTTASATTSVSVTLPSGPSVLSATTTYTIVAALGDLMSIYAQGERVEKITLAATLGGNSAATLITVSGKEYAAPPAALALAGISG
jgi:hypothetical protein